MSEFLAYLEKKAEVSIYIEENFLLKTPDLDFKEDLFFVKGKGPLILELIKVIERKNSIPVINSYQSIYRAINRIINSSLLRKAGVCVPNFSLNPIDSPPPFEEYIVKNVIDQKAYSFKGKIEKKEGHLHVIDERALKEAKSEENYQYYYYQEFVKSKYEFKVYGFGETLYFYRQLPTLVNPNKIETREKIKELPELKEMAIKAKKEIGLEITSIDFLQSKDGTYYLTDINSTPNFNYIERGPQLVADYLISRAKGIIPS